MALSKEDMEEAEREYEKHGYIPITKDLSNDSREEVLAALGQRPVLTKEEREGIKQRQNRYTEKSLYVEPDKKGREMYKEPIGPKRSNIEPIITNEKEYDKYQRDQMEEDIEAREHPRATTQYEYAIGPERPHSSSLGEKFGVKISNFKEGVKSSIGNIKKNYKENAEYNRQLKKRERELKSSPGYIKTKSEHDLYMEEIRARKSGSVSRRSSTKASPSLVSMGTYKPAYSGRSTLPSSGFGGSYKPAYGGQTMAAPMPIVSHKTARVVKSKPVHISSLGSGEIPKMGNFGGSSLMPKMGGMGKKLETPRIGNFTFGAMPKIGGSITHKGSVKSIGLNTNIGKLGEIPKIGFGLKKKPVVKSKTKRRSKKR